MSAGRYDRLVEFHAPVQKRGRAGGAKTQWEPFGECWASKEDVSGGETRRGTQLVAEARHVFELRHWVEGLTTAHRMTVDGVAHDILFIRELGRQESAELQTVVHDVNAANA